MTGLSIKINKPSLLGIVLSVLIVLNLNMLNFGDFTQIIRYITTAASVVLFLICRLNRHIWKKIVPKANYMNKWIIVLFVFMLVEVLIGLRGREGFAEAIGKAHIFSWCLLFYPITYYLSKHNGETRLIKKVCFWSVMAYILRTVVWYMYNFRGKDIMHYVLFEMGRVWMRNGNQRIPDICFSSILFAFMLMKISGSSRFKEKVVPILVVIMQILYANFVYCSRSQIICFAITTAVVIILNRSKARKKIFELIFVFIVGLAVLLSDAFIEFVGGLSTSTSEIGNRVYAFNHFFDLLKGNWLFGFQHVYSGETIRGTLGIAYLSDTGIVENLFCWGIVGFIITTIIFVHWFVITFGKNVKKTSKFPMALALLVMITTYSALSNNIYDSVRLFALPFACALFEFWNIDNPNEI